MVFAPALMFSAAPCNRQRHTLLALVGGDCIRPARRWAGDIELQEDSCMAMGGEENGGIPCSLEAA